MVSWWLPSLLLFLGRLLGKSGQTILLQGTSDKCAQTPDVSERNL